MRPLYISLIGLLGFLLPTFFSVEQTWLPVYLSGSSRNFDSFKKDISSGIDSNEYLYQVQSVITGFSTTTGCSPIQTLSITGSNFGASQGSGQVTVASVPAISYTTWTDNLVLCEVASNLFGSGDIEITNSTGSSASIPQNQTMSTGITYVSGDISGVWDTLCPSIYVLVGDVRIPANQSLTIKPGVTVLAQPDSGGSDIEFLVEGSLSAVGTVNDSIIFSVMPGHESSGSWRGIVLSDNMTKQDQLAFCKVEYAQYGVQAFHAGVSITNSLFQHHSLAGVRWYANGSQASGNMNKCVLDNNPGWGLRVESYSTGGSKADPLISQNTISNNGLGGVYLRSRGGLPSSINCPSFNPCCSKYGLTRTEPVLERNYITGNQGWGIFLYANGSDGSYGVCASYTSEAYTEPILKQNIITNNQFGIKAAEYSEGRITSSWYHNTLYNNGNIQIELDGPAEIDFYNGISWNASSSSIVNNGGVLSVSHSLFSQSVVGPGNLQGNPLFVNPSGGDYRLQFGSPAIDNGNDFLVKDTLDFGFHPRVWDGNCDGITRVDMGAWEFGSDNPLVIALLATPPFCEGEFSGAIDLTLSGGVLPQSISWSSGATTEDLMQITDGNYVVTVTDGNGCVFQDSATLIANNPSYDIALSVSECPLGLPYQFGSQSLTTSGTYTEIFSTIAGCDSVVTLSFSVVQEIQTSDSRTICSDSLPFQFGTQALTASGTYSETFMSSSGCDSTATLSLNVLQSYFESDSTKICNTMVPIFWEGFQIWEEGTYTANYSTLEGCDSVISLTVFIDSASQTTTDSTICADQFPFLWGNLSVFSEGTYDQVFTSSGGCDSAVTLNLALAQDYNQALNITACTNDLPYQFGNQTLSSPGIYSELFTSKFGCDSLVEISFSIATNPAKPTLGQISKDSLAVFDPGDSYIWYINGFQLQGQDDSVIAPLVSGQYQVQVIINGCASELSDPIPFLATSLESDSFSGRHLEIFPIPTEDKIFIKFSPVSQVFHGSEFTIVDARGRIVGSGKLELPNPMSPIELDVSQLSSGIYSLRITTEQDLMSGRFLKTN